MQRKLIGKHIQQGPYSQNISRLKVAHILPIKEKILK